MPKLPLTITSLSYTNPIRSRFLIIKQTKKILSEKRNVKKGNEKKGKTINYHSKQNMKSKQWPHFTP